MPSRPLRALALAPLALAVPAYAFARWDAKPVPAVAPAAPEPSAAEPIDTIAPDKLAAEFAAADSPESIRALRESMRTRRPLAALAQLLCDPRLTVRLGALECLEDLTGADLAFDPWSPSDSPENLAAITRLRERIAATGPAAPAHAFDESSLRAYLHDAIGDDESRAESALRLLRRHGVHSLRVLESHRLASPDLADAAKARLDRARFTIALHEAGASAAASIARDLTFGTRDRRLEALGALRVIGPGALPVTAEFLRHPDALVRETAYDVFMSVGGEGTHETVSTLIKSETDLNVLHTVLRAIGEKRSATGNAIARSLLAHPDEEIVCGALECFLPKQSYGNSHAALDEDTLARLRTLATDPRWRLRAAAIDAIARLKLAAENALIVRSLDDPDPFVRACGIRAAAECHTLELIPKLTALTESDDDTQMPAVRALIALGKPIPENLCRRIPSMPRDRILAWITPSQGVQETRVTPPLSTLVALAASTDQDIARAALFALFEAYPGEPDTLRFAEAAIASASPETLTAILEKLPVPAKGAAAPAVVTPAAARPSGEVNTLFALFSGKKAAAPASSTVATPTAAAAPVATPKSAEALLRPLLAHRDPLVARTALLRLAISGDADALSKISALWPGLDDDTRLGSADRITLPGTPQAASFLRVLLRDPLPGVRRSTLTRMSSDSAELRRAAIGALAETDSPLRAAEVFEPLQWRIEYEDRRSGTLEKDGLALLKPDHPEDRIILGLLLASRPIGRMSDTELARWTGHTSPLVRRAAWYSLSLSTPRRAAAKIADITGDPDPAVRAVATRLALPAAFPWEHRFSASSSVTRESSYNSGDEAGDPLRKSVPPALTKLLDDTDPAVRLDAALALIAIGKPVDTARYAEIMRVQPDRASAIRRIASLLNSTARTLPRATLVKLASAIPVDQLGSDTRDQLAGRGDSDEPRAAAPLTFAALTSVAPAPATLEGATTPVAAVTAPALAPARIPLVFFMKPGCRECDRVDSLLRTITAADPAVTIIRHNILDTDGLLLNRRLSDLRAVPLREVGKTPAVFGPAGQLVGETVSGHELERLITRARQPGAPADDAWTRLPESERPALAGKVTETYAALSLAVILGAGLLDGLNPCAFATLIFFISYLRVAKRSPREILLVGAAFVSAVYLTYFAIGVGLHGALGALAGFAWLRGLLNFGFAAFALTLAALSIRDGFLARAGKLRDMRLQLPDFLKNRVRGVIREGAKTRRFIAFAFVSGIAISLLELACTGQVYAPIVNQIRQGSLHAVGALAAYNAAFILPLLAVFALAYAGLRVESLVRFQEKNTAAIRFLTAALFITLAALILIAEWRA